MSERALGSKIEKICTKCLKVKLLTDFYPAPKHKDGREYRCKVCAKYSVWQWIKRNPEKNRIKTKVYKQKNPHIVKAIELKTREKNRERKRAADRLAYRQNPKLWIAGATRRKKHVKKATPKWVKPGTKEWEQIKQIYVTCPKGYHVDHIIPLRGESVSGLHVPWNLQHLPAQDNMKKGNYVKL